jgi:hypothetical protein
MKREVSPNHPIREYFARAVHWSLNEQLGVKGHDDMESYLAQLLVAFLHFELIYAVKDAQGRPVDTVYEMLQEADVRLRAESFEREREVHRHIGDFLLFWSGVFPDHWLERNGRGAFAEAVRQGKASYFIVSSFDHVPYAEEAPLFRKLSNHFEACREGLTMIRASFEGFRSPGFGKLST